MVIPYMPMLVPPINWTGYGIHASPFEFEHFLKLVEVLLPLLGLRVNFFLDNTGTGSYT